MRDLASHGYKEVTLLGQNVNSYRYLSGDDANGTQGEVTFPVLLRMVARAVPGMRVRFTTSHPKDMSDDAALCPAAACLPTSLPDIAAKRRTTTGFRSN